MDSSIGIQAFEWVARLASKLSPGSSSRQSESIDKVLWSAPQGFRYMRPLKMDEGVESAEVRFLDGQQMHGRLERFNPSGISLKLRLKLNRQVLHLAHAQIKRVTLAEPVAMMTSPRSSGRLLEAPTPCWCGPPLSIRKLSLAPSLLA